MLRSVCAAASSVVATDRVAAACERSLEGTSGRRVLDAVTSGPYRTLV
jgi:hypothetical protein